MASKIKCPHCHKRFKWSHLCRALERKNFSGLKKLKNKDFGVTRDKDS